MVREEKESLIRGRGAVVITGMKRIQPKLMTTFRITADEFHLVGKRRRLAERNRLQHPEDHEGAVRQHVLQGNVLSRKIVPFQLGFFDEENFAFIPAGNFHAKGFSTEERLESAHGHLENKGSSFQAKAGGEKY